MPDTERNGAPAAVAKALRSKDNNEASEAGRALGRIRTARKAETARQNLAKRTSFGGPKIKDPLTLPCTCGAGTETIVGERHKTTCPRGRLLYQRARVAAAAAATQQVH